MKRQNRKRYESNLAELRTLKAKLGLEVLQFNELHFRIVGEHKVDYWPSTGKAWRFESESRGRKVTTAEACGMAMLESAHGNV